MYRPVHGGLACICFFLWVFIVKTALNFFNAVLCSSVG